MAAIEKRPAELDGEALAHLVDEVTTKVRADGAVARSTLGAPKASMPALLDRLSARGLEVRPKFVRLPLTTQLDVVLARGSTPVQGLEKRLAGGATRTEARTALTRLVNEGRALVVRGGNKDGIAMRPPGDTLETPDRARLAAVAKALAALAKAPGRSALAPRARWNDVHELLADVLGDVPVPPSRSADGRRASATTNCLLDGSPAPLLETLRAASDESGIAAVAEAARLLDPPWSAAALATGLRELAATGAVELRIASQPHLLSADDRALCPTDPAGRVLAYARVIGA